MLGRCLCLLAGAYALGLVDSLPHDDLALSLSLACACCFRHRSMRPAGWFLAGFLAMWLAAWDIVSDRLAPRLSGETIVLEMTIGGFPQAGEGGLRFIAAQSQRADIPRRLRLSWFNPAVQPLPGERWQLRIRLRQPHGYANPHGFDFEGWLFRERIGATGYVVAHRNNRRLENHPVSVLDGFRQRFAGRVAALLPDDDAAAVLLAVAAGARHRISAAEWDRYAKTGTSHLVAVSGLHVGLAAGGTAALAWGLLGVFLPRSNLRAAAIVAGVVAAAGYALVAGFAVPAMRAFLMAAIAAGTLLWRRRVRPGTLIAVPCLLVFLADPVSILAPGFMLSFGAVAILLWTHFRDRSDAAGRDESAARRAGRAVRRLCTLQFALLAGLFPLVGVLFGRFPALAPLTNLLILPVFNFVTVPFGLLGMLLDGPFAVVGDLLLRTAWWSIRAVLTVIAAVADLPGAGFELRPLTGVSLLLACLPLAWVVLPPGWPGRRLTWLAIASLLLQRPHELPAGCLEYHVLDVGQGLAIVMQAGNRTVLFDTGPSYMSGASTAELVVLPFLAALGVTRLDALVVSHADQDHAGGVPAILAALEIGDLYVGETLPGTDLAQRPCNASVGWQLAGVGFRFLHPAAGTTWEGNNASCVLLVTSGDYRLLLTGDIERPAEAVLIDRLRGLPMDTVVIPHHGSRTSSSAALVAATRPSLAIAASGFGNRWSFPAAEVVSRWRAAGAEVADTAARGAVSRRVCGGMPGPVSYARIEGRKYWHRGPVDRQ